MKKKKVTIILTIILLIIFGLGFYFLFIRKDDSGLTLSEKQWIDSNKNKRIDIGVQVEVPLYNYNGEGIILNLLDQFEEKWGLEFNRITNTEDDQITSFIQKDQIDKNDIIIAEDYDVLVTKNKESYSNHSDITEMTIGVLKNKLDTISQILDNGKLSYKAFDSESQMLTELNKEDSSLGGAIVSKTKNLDTILQNNLTIAYPIIDQKHYFVFDLGSDKTFNSVFKKYYEKWKAENYDEEFEIQFVNLYHDLKEVSDKEKSSLKSKTYTYGFVDAKPYHSLKKGELIGINYYIMRGFYRMTGIEITYKKYKTMESLTKDFENGKIDFMFNNTSSRDGFQTVGVYNNEGVILTSKENSLKASAFYGLKDQTVMTLKNSQVEKILSENQIKYKSYNTMDELIKKVKQNSVIALDNYQWDYYHSQKLKQFMPLFTFKMQSYGYSINEHSTTPVFREMFNFYLSYMDSKEMIRQGVLEDAHEQNILLLIKDLIIYAFSFLGIFFSIRLLYQKISKPKEKRIKMGKEDKIKYIDQLTSLKNRVYLNEQLPEWEKSKIFPQSIVVVDLNNLAYINDNYGHEEGDSVICKAANILIQNQMINSEIIRTSGNEFLIYLVGFEEKQIVSYMKKLNKEFKNLPHGFGAAMGYSMIKDDIKTIDDAINESTLDMKANKEEAKKA